MANYTSLLGIPVELRTHIYSHLLPFVERAWWPGMPLAQHEPDIFEKNWFDRAEWLEDHPDPLNCSSTEEAIPKTSSTTFMRTCRQIYHESADYLYSHGKIGVHIDGKWLSLLRQTIVPSAEHIPYFGALQHARNIDVRIRVNHLHDPMEACNAHALISYLARWLEQNKLQSLCIFFDIFFLPSDGEDSPLGAASLKSELSQHKAGDLTRQHIAAFMMDPLRSIRLAAGGKVAMDVCFELSAFQQVRNVLEKEMLTAKPPPSPSYGPFIPYIQALKAVDGMVRSYAEQYRYYFRLGEPPPTNAIVHEIIRGDLKEMTAHHEKYVRCVLTRLRDPMPGGHRYRQDYDCFQPQPLTDGRAVEFGRALTRLATSLPRTLDVSALGPTLVDKAIVGWKAAHKAKFMAKRRRMREEERFARGAGKRLKREDGGDLSVEVWPVCEDGAGDTDFDDQGYGDGRRYDKFLGGEEQDSDAVIWG
ncbi:hypothetical protein Q7P37_002965 [Cladosporium fusiforme]